MDANETDRAIRAIQAAHRYGDEACRKLQAARAWATLWKKAAKENRAWRLLMQGVRRAEAQHVYWLRRELQNVYEENNLLREECQFWKEEAAKWGDLYRSVGSEEATDGNDPS